MGLGCRLLGVLLESLGLETEALAKACVDMDQKVVVNFYPKCPQPDMTLGLKRHTNPGTITLLLQDQVGGGGCRRPRMVERLGSPLNPLMVPLWSTLETMDM
ncbi:hypothetical protein AMTR_s00041p00220940 [Amborella trichopoda]|uniref:Isopenicillin N synthase-like Fe(2+) 2OG dioxygenase domain-containing protein n=1 Tax=Amborella trichopoda TaxID=13333 RepID=W1PYT4_AMBTC|nr:hypothetical protein AMTR_s00041p00220940 [Amborella trichopoda]